VRRQPPGRGPARGSCRSLLFDGPIGSSATDAMSKSDKTTLFDLVGSKFDTIARNMDRLEFNFFRCFLVKFGFHFRVKIIIDCPLDCVEVAARRLVVIIFLDLYIQVYAKPCFQLNLACERVVFLIEHVDGEDIDVIDSKNSTRVDHVTP
jgi:hypothetical protein